MASISSTSTSSSSSLGNTSLRGFGGMTSGIDRDSIIEQMTLGTTTKINNQKKKVTQLQWKQEAYRNVSDKIIDLTDKYASFSSSTNLKDATAFAKNLVSVHGKESSTSFVTAKGTSDLIGNVSIAGVGQLATSTVRHSQTHSATIRNGTIPGATGTEYTTGIITSLGSNSGTGEFNNLGDVAYSSSLQGLKLEFGNPPDTNGKIEKTAEFVFEAQVDGASINYTPKTKQQYDKLVEDLNNLAKEQDIIKFSVGGTEGNYYLTIQGGTNLGNQVIRNSSTALGALGFTGKDSSGNAIEGVEPSDGISINEFDKGQTVKNFEQSGMVQRSVLDYLTGRTLAFNYDGSQKQIELITSEEAKQVKELTVDDLGTNAQTRVSRETELKKLGISVSKDLMSIREELDIKLEEQKGKLGKATNDQEKNTIEGNITQIEKHLKAIKTKLENATEPEKLEVYDLGADYQTGGSERNELKSLGIFVSKDLMSIQKELNIKLEEQKAIKGDTTKIEDHLSAINTKQMKTLDANSKLTSRFDQAFGTGMVQAKFSDQGMSFAVKKDSSTLKVVSNDYTLLGVLGMSYGESNKVNLSGTLSQMALKGALGENIETYTKGAEGEKELDLQINGVSIDGLKKDSSIKDILSKINSSKAGVKATYIETTGEFMLISSETGEGRQITLDSSLAKSLFGQKGADGNYEAAKGVDGGKNAEIYVSYGDGKTVKFDRASNTFDLEGLSVTVSGTFGGVTNGNVTDTSAAVTFSAKADVDAAVEKAKSFFTDFNALVTQINSEVRTRPDSAYQPLTDEQKAQMDETSIKNWETKAKQGMLYGDSVMRDLSGSVQGIFSKMLGNGVSYEELKEVGISYSEDYADGGTLVFDESAFRTAMENNPEKVSRIFAGGNGVSKGLISEVEDAFTPYATRYANRNGGSYGRLVEIAGSNKKPTTLMSNSIYKQLKEMQNTIDSLQERLETERDRYISQFTTMESLLNKMNAQSSYLSQLTG